MSSAPNERGKEQKAPLSRRLNKRIARGAKKTEDIADGADHFQKSWEASVEEHSNLPDRPTVTSTQTRADSSPPTVSSAPGQGIEAGTLTSAGMAVAVAVAGASEMINRRRRHREASSAG
ncbi:hypothetical protein LWF15_01160 [Kineosporia rhizophila]|uniref:hypothetical protein n=1 Tax=Kineosporia rhizophila TaxID=84633 RepID=UPI000ADAB1CA|nr:hypothetical protein [Kineosporia rhizophila]MCE0534112.1 hypothetical protein [Kineosporia rhizophila]